ncbi:hypothetical protein TNCV_1992401 [Trichonephila clavipes]|nr:hypothetical protein TNCV_1992401 [Trichonephila clavipes]
MAAEKSGDEKNIAMNPEKSAPTVKHDKGGVMVWGAMAATGVGNLVFTDSNMNKFGYLKILQKQSTPIGPKIGTWEQLCLPTRQRSEAHS